MSFNESYALVQVSCIAYFGHFLRFICNQNEFYFDVIRDVLYIQFQLGILLLTMSNCNVCNGLFDVVVCRLSSPLISHFSIS